MLKLVKRATTQMLNFATVVCHLLFSLSSVITSNTVVYLRVISPPIEVLKKFKI